MKKVILLIGALIICANAIKAQSAYCPGLKNPTNFTLTGGPAGAVWYGYIGSKNAQVSTCTTPGSTFGTTAIPATDLLSQTGGSSCYGNSSQDINNQSDNMRRFVIKGAGYDPETNNQLSYLPPDTSFHSSIRVGNFCGGTQAEMLVYEFKVFPQNAMVTIWYAMSLFDASHTAQYNPEFMITIERAIEDANGNVTGWTLAAGDTLCYIQQTPVTGASSIAPFSQGNSTNVWLNWNKVLINVYHLLYRKIRIKVATGDCAYSAHYGCSYIAGECAPMALQGTGCAAGETESVTRISAPKGAEAYEWYRSKTGKLTGDAVNVLSNYVQITGANDSVLNVEIPHFVDSYTNPAHPDTVSQNTFMCKMTTRMNPTKPVISRIYTDVGNTKPTLILDSAHGCDAQITLHDRSVTPYDPNETDKVDTTKTQWRFYNSANPSDATLAGTYVGPHATHFFPTAGIYSARVRTTAYDTTCWNEKTVKVRVFKSPTPRVDIERNNLCKGDTINIRDLTSGSGFHRWTFRSPLVDTTYNTNIGVTRFSFDTTTEVTLLTRGSQYFMADTTGDGIPEQVYCYTDTTFTIYVGEYPRIHVAGDTIVCNGDQSNVTVSSDNVPDSRFDWYQILGGGTPIVENNNHLQTPLTQDRTYYVKATSPFGCVTWDSIELKLVKPDLYADKDRICTGDTVTLTAGSAAYFEWTSIPPDPYLTGQSENSVIKVSPLETTTYSVVGHGTNGCGATALTQKVTVFPYPILHVQLTPDYIDSENPSVQFADLSEYGTTSLWNFGNGNTSSTRTVVFTFTDLSQDSIQVSLTTGNALGCTNDTSFYVPVGIFAVWFPNAFTPGLETNNRFFPFTANELENYELYIYDRAGSLVFSTKDVTDSWDGTYKGNKCKEGSYVYIAKYRRKGVNRMMSQKGTVTLLR